MKAFQAYGPAGKVTRETAKQAAEAYFSEFPKSRKCDVIQGEDDGLFFTVTYGRKSDGKWPLSYKNVTRKTISELEN